MAEAPRPAGSGPATAAEAEAFPGEWYALASADHFWLRWRLQAALRQIDAVGLPRDRPLRALDVGGGMGVLRAQLEERTAWIIDITDLHPSAVSGARRGRGRNLRYDVREHRPDMLGAYDVVVLFDVLEHVEAPVGFLESLARHLKEGGRLLVNVPALRALFSGYDVAAGHLRRYDRSSLSAEARAAGFVVEDVRYWGLTLVPLLLLRKVVLAGRTGEGVIRSGFRPPGAWLNSALVALMRAETALAARPPLGTSVLLAARKPA